MQTANLKSLANISCWINDESEELIDEDIFDTINLSIRSKDCHNYVILILNPSNKDHWIYKRWIANTHKVEYFDGYPVEISTHPEVLHLHGTYLDNIKNLSDSFIATMQRMKVEQPKLYGLKVIGQWSDIAEGALFPKANLNTFKHSEILERQFESSLAYIDVADSGTDFTCMYIGRNIGARIYITDIIFTEGNSDVSIPQILSALAKNKVSYVRVESNNMGAIYARELSKQAKSTEVLTCVSTTNKHTRILMDSPAINNYFMFKEQSERNAMYEAALDQLSIYTKDGKAKHDDSADAASGLVRFVQSMLPDYYL